jgi:2-phosphosulfolactate phosphatase
MEIRIESLIEGARRAKGTVVIIDVFRAFTTAAVALAGGAEQIVIVTQPQEALRLRDQGVGDLCVGEMNGQRPEGFDYGNSPYQMSQAPLMGKVIILSTRSGTAGVEATTGAETIYGCSFVTAAATARALLHDSPPLVTLVAMGYNGLVRTDEDELCALYLRNLLQGRRPDPQAICRLVQQSGEAARLAALHPPHGYPQDLEIALEIDKYDFAVRIAKEKDFFMARRHDG